MILALEVQIRAQVQVHLAVAIVVSGRHARKRTLGLLLETESVQAITKSSRSIVEEQQRPGGREHDQVLDAEVSKVEEQCLGGVVQNSDARLLGSVPPDPVGRPAVEPIGQPARLAHVQLVPSVIVDVADRHSLVAVDPDTGSGIQP